MAKREHGKAQLSLDVEWRSDLGDWRVQARDTSEQRLVGALGLPETATFEELSEAARAWAAKQGFAPRVLWTGIEVGAGHISASSDDLVPALELKSFAAQFRGVLLRTEPYHFVFRFPDDAAARSFYWIVIHGKDVRNVWQRALDAVSGTGSVRSDEVWVAVRFPPRVSSSVEQRTEPHPLPQRVPVQSIRLYRAEGRKTETGERIVTSFAAADSVLRDWARTAPRDGSYHKTDFTITFADREKYEGRFDLERAHAATSDLLARHVREHVLFVLGLQRPPHMTEARYRNYLEQLAPDTAAYERLVEKYDIPGLATEAARSRKQSGTA